MCGIAGIIGPSACSSSGAEMARALVHRGPDGEGIWSAEGIVLAHRRLAIIDIEGGKQPMRSASGRWVLVYNGEVYNFQELRKDHLADYPYQTRSDTEVVLAALERWGEGACSRLEGMFAFAAYNTVERRVLLARDGQGIKPAYYSAIPGGSTAFASEITALLSVGVQAEVDEQALDSFLDIRFVPAPRTLFRGVRKLMPGHFIWIDGNGVPGDQIPFMPPVQTIDKVSSRREFIDRIESTLMKVVNRQLVADVPVGVLLSGGVDSAMVASAAVKSSAQVDTFCVGYDLDHWSNEFAEARRTAGYLGTNHHEVVIDQSSATIGMEHLIRHLEEPVVTTSVFSYYLLCREVAVHRKVVLTGQGADEPWGGYGRHRVAALEPVLGPITRHMPADHSLLGRYEERMNRLRAALLPRDEVGKWLGLYTLFTGGDRDEIRCMASDANSVAKAALTYTRSLLPEGGTFLERFLAVDTRSGLPDNLLLLGDKLSMAWGLEVRVPLLDPLYLRVVESLPGHMRRGGFLAHIGKLLHKQVALRFVPREVVSRPKKGFQTPIEEWLKGQLGERLLDLASSGRSFTRRYLNLPTVERMLMEHRLRRRGNLERQLFAVWVLEEWARHFITSSSKFRTKDSD